MEIGIDNPLDEGDRTIKICLNADKRHTRFMRCEIDQCNERMHTFRSGRAYCTVHFIQMQASKQTSEDKDQKKCQNSND